MIQIESKMKKSMHVLNNQLADMLLLKEQIVVLLQKTTLTEGKILHTATGLCQLARIIPSFPPSLLQPFEEAINEKNIQKIFSMNTQILATLEELLH